MKAIKAIAQKEWLILLANPVGYIFGALLLLISNGLFFENFFVNNQASLSGYWSTMAYLLSLFIPAITMNAIAEERKNNTWEVLLTQPINEMQLVVGKFIGMAGYVLGILALSLPLVVEMHFLGNPDWGMLVGGWLGMALMALVYVAIGIMASSWTGQPIAAFLIALAILLLNSLIGQGTFSQSLPPIIGDIISYLSISWHSTRMGEGIIAASDVTVLGALATIALTMAYLALKNRNK